MARCLAQRTGGVKPSGDEGVKKSEIGVTLLS